MKGGPDITAQETKHLSISQMFEHRHEATFSIQDGL